MTQKPDRRITIAKFSIIKFKIPHKIQERERFVVPAFTSLWGSIGDGTIHL